ncbi:class I SAM-dependent methyltransferase [Tamlana sp. 2201CG12-4]|uniref:THUMP-like domain-containing protein n=1 Tax=Tamlana sp. 2201CG12-4 TaxID=3112582 RepID=UPI002DBF3927|nr:class I SAM-dependent methyltransferase [Tamlana sp. 2201CG12-4]MEC3907893.1 class I SAM-dependent methyltransferase [Tamlana sp. 2201CG12-4]
MNSVILNTKIQEFINEHLKSDISSLLLKGISFSGVETKEIIEQIEAKKRSEKKLPSWFNCKNIYYPNKLNIEQTSSELTAKFKSELITGDSIIDLTGGFGVDCYYFSRRFKIVEHCEINKKLSDIAKHNFKQFKINHVETTSLNGIENLKTSNKHYDWIYIDPSRRHDTKGKVFLLNDCQPNIPKHLDLLFKRSKNIMVKTSPLLDISNGVKELTHVKTIYVVAINNEVKELLWILENKFEDDITIKTVNIKNEKAEHFTTSISYEKASDSEYHKPLSYLYEPNSAVLKAGAFNSISKKLNVYKLHKHSHLYTHKALVEFPGRRFKIEGICPYNKKDLKKLAITKANITTRNFPETVQQIRKKHKIKDGGEDYLFFTTDMENNRVVICTTKV